MSEFLQRIGVELPVVQAGMGGGLSGSELAAARRLTGRPIAVNLLLPFARRGHFEAAEAADVVVTFWGRPRRRVGGTWIHQAGSVEEARAAREAGADAVIAQGVEAGGHVRGTVPAAELLERVRAAVGPGYPVLSAGGIVDAADVSSRLDAGAEAIVSGTRFLMSEESGAHPAYKERLTGARETLLTQLFGMGWPAPHRVVPNAATERWTAGDRRGPGWVRAVQRATAPALSRLPVPVQQRVASTQRADRPVFGPAAATSERSANLVDAGPLYAGECIARIDDVRPAAELVRELAP